MRKKKHQIIVVGLPKTGTSTITVMLRMLGYTVTGPEINFQPGDDAYLLEQCNNFDAFQDYPWCFEWKRFVANNRVLFLELKRDPETWWQSFYDSYGGKSINYLAYSYMGLEKNESNKQFFLEYFESFYSEFEEFKKQHPERVLSLNIASFQWKEICNFLNEPIPTNAWGKPLKIPHVHASHHKKRKSRFYRLKIGLRQMLLPLVGKENWLRFTIFLRKFNLFP